MVGYSSFVPSFALVLVHTDKGLTIGFRLLHETDVLKRRGRVAPQETIAFSTSVTPVRK